jgi:hypothetical protein
MRKNNQLCSLGVFNRSLIYRTNEVADLRIALLYTFDSSFECTKPVVSIEEYILLEYTNQMQGVISTEFVLEFISLSIIFNPYPICDLSEVLRSVNFN